MMREKSGMQIEKAGCGTMLRFPCGCRVFDYGAWKCKSGLRPGCRASHELGRHDES